ncbi:Sulfotransferase family protein [Thermomonospora echinospora]|uniref:Sulfotransferase family protein n=1 Tax=Thermomonospora echinospora TaxID=1992 RepID=A0A1H6B0W0_9ACTN|nr:sulfotransferase [Thermomonospora echinospora]SEG54272.1 Sulfotransferase family protein [Thermomonospora echinospora]
MALPDVLVIGAPKAGTTALHSGLARHPRLFMSPVKEPKFFLTDGPPPTRGGPGDAQTYREHVWRRADYEALFDGAPPGALCGESTPFYLHDLEAQLRIRRLIPDVRLIAVLRDPVERAHSNWAHLWSAGLEPIGDVVEACAAEEQRVRAGWAAFWRYTGLGRYGEQLQHLFKLFPREQVLLLRYREVRDTPRATLDRICAFLGVETGLISTIPAENVTRHVSDSPANRALQVLLRGGASLGRYMPEAVRQTARRPFLSLLQRDPRLRRPPAPEQRERLLPYFEDDIALFQELTGWDCADWLKVG